MASTSGAVDKFPREGLKSRMTKLVQQIPGYGAVKFDDVKPLVSPVDKMAAETKMGISQQTLVSNQQKAKRITQYMAALTATIGGFIMGTILGWTSPAGDRLIAGEYPFLVTESDLSFIGSSMALGAVFGSPVVGNLVDTVGRKNTMLLLAVPTVTESDLSFIGSSMALGAVFGSPVVGNLVDTVGRKNTMLLLAVPRFYIGTYEGKSCHSFISSTITNISCYLKSWIASVYGLSIICALLPIFFVGLMLLMPESPQFHLKKNRVKQAKESLQWFRGSEYDIDSEITDMQNSLEKERSDKVPLMQAFSTPAAKRGLLIGLGVMFIQQFGGINAVVFYTVKIFKDAGSSLNPNLCTIIVGTIMMVTTWIATMIVDRLGRRILLLVSAVIMALSTLTMGYYFYLKNSGSDVSNIGWLPLGSLCVFIIVFSLGFGPIPWMLVGEIFPSQIKGIAVSIACLFNWVSVLVVTKFFGDVTLLLGGHGAFWIFSVIAALGAVFTYILVPETKGKTLDEIQMELGGNGESNENVMVVVDTKDGKY
ncbi:facilitated trehalose transporter Tret1-2 homolog [Diaphorina citri]|uniref:Facilitated trehalose transporter Tret1-2 homolog n=1 Tax=Diaphorina citri TaxID=121845 RepID=A0A3Q0IV31_DIACI|nr:facilitated trehalose transporter Tret1-2 homolog [Diaphorina citri]